MGQDVIHTRDAIVWVDPGLKTGIAVWGVSEAKLWHVVEADFTGTGSYLKDVRSCWNRVAIGWESFFITSKTAKNTQAPWSLEVIGMCRWFAYESGWETLPPAKPADRELGQKKWVDALEWCPRGLRDDGMSACQHLLAWLLRTQLAPSYIYDTITRTQ